MTTQEFINKNYNTKANKERKCSSVYADNSGNIFSYGRHYPLLFTVKGLTFRNTRGYSNTTAKHILWAGGHNAIDVKLSGCNLYTWNNPESMDKVPKLLSLFVPSFANQGITENDIMHAILSDLETERAELIEAMESKTRTDTQVFKALQSQYEKVLKSIITVEGAL